MFENCKVKCVQQSGTRTTEIEVPIPDFLAMLKEAEEANKEKEKEKKTESHAPAKAHK